MSDDEEETGEFQQNGAVFRLKFSNFMQYRDTEFFLGPNLNVIIGPNGSGKSTLVNGICIGLAGKLNVLGRATSITEFITVGEKEAFVEVELYMHRQKNIIIKRRFDRNAKNFWSLDGKKVSEKEVRDRVAKLKIQVDNLCQFLPQDKVHDFSRLDNKGLLDSTIDAVGELRLKDKHAELKELQRQVTEGGTNLEKKVQLLEEKQAMFNRLEQDVAVFHERLNLTGKIESLQRKKLWCAFDDSKKKCLVLRTHLHDAKDRFEKQEKTLEPLRKEITKIEKKKTKFTAKVEELDKSMKELVGTAKKESLKVERFDAEIDAMAEEIDNIDRKEQETKEKMNKLESEIRNLQQDISELPEETELDARAREAKTCAQRLQESYEKEKQSIISKKHEIKNVDTKLRLDDSEIRSLKDIDNQKLEVLKKKSMDAHKALMWLRNNKSSFDGEVYEPFIVCGNVTDTKNAIYVENTVHIRDLTIFFFEKAEDMNKFLNQTRTTLKLKVSAATLPDKPAAEFVPTVKPEELKEFRFVSYVKDMITAPDKVISYMCKIYNLQNTAVFEKDGENYSDIIMERHSKHFRTIYFGSKRQTVQRSAYSGKITLKTTEATSHNTLTLSLDQERINALTEGMKQLKGVRERLSADISSIEENVKQTGLQVEAARQQHKDVESERRSLKEFKAKLECTRQRLRQLSTRTNAEDEKREMLRQTAQLTKNQSQAVTKLASTISSMGTISLDAARYRLAIRPFQGILDEKKATLTGLKDELQEIQNEVDVRQEEYKISQQDMLKNLKEAKAATGLEQGTKDRPPQKMRESWKQEEFPDTVEEIESLVCQLEARASCTDSVDGKVIETYNTLKEEIASLETEIGRKSRQAESLSGRISELREEWLAILSELVDNINTRFFNFFRVLGFVGGVRLSKGAHDNDFDNYGLKIFVKYRNSEPLQELNPHHQSGGERSVATAIYMLALQALTTVPFRCVDEINQGMDARNERLVFDLLVNTSCKENNAQYFLLTPKLLPGLDYHPRMNILVVHNGPEMCHHSKWDMDRFKQLVASG